MQKVCVTMRKKKKSEEFGDKKEKLLQEYGLEWGEGERKNDGYF